MTFLRSSALWALCLLPPSAGALQAQDGGLDLHRLPLGHPVYKYDLRLLVRDRIYSAREDRNLSFREFLEALEPYRVILLGEDHDNLAIHRFQARVVEALASRKRPLVVGMEFFAPTDDLFLEEYVRGRRGLVSLLTAADWPAKGGFNYRYYQPILEAARAGGARIVGLNVPRDVVRTVARKGVEALTAEQRSLFPPLDLSLTEHRYLIRCFFGRPAVTSPAFFEKFYAAQAIWDTAMAANALAAMDRAGPRSKVVVIVGAGHVMYGLGIGRRIRMLRPEVPVAEVVLLPVEARKAPRGMGHPTAGRARASKGKKKGSGKAGTTRQGGKKTSSRPHSKGKPGKAGKGPSPKGAEAKARRPMGHPAMGMGSLRPGRIVSRSLGTFLVGTAPAGKEFPPLPMRLGLRGGKVVVLSLPRGGALEKAGLRRGDRVLSIGGRPCRSPAEEMVRLMALDWGDLLEVRAARGKKKVFTVAVRLRRPGGEAGKTGTGRGPKFVGLHHSLEVELDPATHLVKWRDRVTIPAALLGRRQGRIVFHLSPSFRPVLGKGGEGVVLRPSPGGKKGGDSWELLFSPPFGGPRKVELAAAGKVFAPPASGGEEYARGFQVTRGTLEERGVFLSGGTGWVPAFEGGGLFTYDLLVRAPASWEVISQGRRVGRVKGRGKTETRFSAGKPQEEVYLVGGPLHEYDGNAGPVETMVFLRKEDPGLAGRYLGASARYLGMYSRMLGPYPWTKFATVENFWETGYGMPSFTLLGPSVIRFPWILHSSFPHEILHDWWGNGVYVDYSKGNWCEGLTAYLADHLLQEQRGGGRAYRRRVLEKYTNFAAGEGRDFPLSDFRERHDPATEAVGYGKALMVFHMVRRMLGDGKFLEALRAFYLGMRFKKASWEDLRRYFEAVGDLDLTPWFAQWIGKRGAPTLRPLQARAVQKGEGYELTFRVRQEQKGEARRVRLPYAVHLAGRKRAVIRWAVLDEKEETVTSRFLSLPLRVEVDPRFDVFRRLLPEEIPPTIGAVLGAREALVVPPRGYAPGHESGYKPFLDLLGKGGKGKVEILSPGKTFSPASLPPGKALWILGRDNPLFGLVKEMLRRAGGRWEEGRVVFSKGGRSLSPDRESLAAALPLPGAPGRFLVFLSLADPSAGAALARKLPHYGKYGYLAFRGGEAVNTAKGRWAWRNTPMVLPVRFEGKAPAGKVDSVLPPEVPLWPLRRPGPGGRHPGRG